MKLKMKLGVFLWLVCAGWMVLAVNQSLSYEVNINDCSNMVYRAENRFDMIGVDTMIAEKYMSDGSSHVWIIVNMLGYQIPFETTNLLPGVDFWNYQPDKVYQNTSEIVYKYPSLKSEYCE